MSELSVEIEAGIARVTIQRPEQRNALTPELLRSLRDAFHSASTDPKIRVVTLTGAGDQVFCAGADLKAAAANRGPGGDYRELLLEIRRCRKPTVALARGHVLAGGMGLFLACDLTLACDDVQFSTPEIGVGMFPMMILAFLRENLPRKRINELAFLGEKFGTAQALEAGMLNHAYPRARFEEASTEFVGKIASKSGAILAIGKETMLETEGLPLEEALAALEKGLARVMASQDSKEGIRSFVEKRKPQWSHT